MASQKQVAFSLTSSEEETNPPLLFTIGRLPGAMLASSGGYASFPGPRTLCWAEFNVLILRKWSCTWGTEHLRASVLLWRLHSEVATSEVPRYKLVAPKVTPLGTLCKPGFTQASCRIFLNSSGNLLAIPGVPKTPPGCRIPTLFPTESHLCFFKRPTGLCKGLGPLTKLLPKESPKLPWPLQ